jgi:hypothetical protein
MLNRAGHGDHGESYHTGGNPCGRGGECCDVQELRQLREEVSTLRKAYSQGLLNAGC